MHFSISLSFRHAPSFVHPSLAMKDCFKRVLYRRGDEGGAGGTSSISYFANCEESRNLRKWFREWLSERNFYFYLRWSRVFMQTIMLQETTIAQFDTYIVAIVAVVMNILSSFPWIGGRIVSVSVVQLFRLEYSMWNVNDFFFTWVEIRFDSLRWGNRELGMTKVGLPKMDLPDNRNRP